jgi:hypothetical protein
VKCPFGVSIVSAAKFMQVGDIHLLLCNLLTCAHTKVSCLEIEKTKLDEKLIRF